MRGRQSSARGNAGRVNIAAQQTNEVHHWDNVYYGDDHGNWQQEEIYFEQEQDYGYETADYAAMPSNEYEVQQFEEYDGYEYNDYWEGPDGSGW